MSKFYFTFGINPIYPYQNGYIIIEAESLSQSIEYFKILFPNPEKPYLLRCAFYYTEQQWEKASANHSMKFYGTYLKRNGEPFAHQITRPILQTDVIGVVIVNPNN